MTAMQWGPPPTVAELFAHHERGDWWLARWTGDGPPVLAGFASFNADYDDSQPDPNTRPDAEIDGYPIDADKHEFAPLRSSDGEPVERITGAEAEAAFWRTDATWLQANGRCYVCRKRCVRSGANAYRIHKRCEPLPIAAGGGR